MDNLKCPVGFDTYEVSQEPGFFSCHIPRPRVFIVPCRILTF